MCEYPTENTTSCTPDSLAIGELVRVTIKNAPEKTVDCVGVVIGHDKNTSLIAYFKPDDAESPVNFMYYGGKEEGESVRLIPKRDACYVKYGIINGIHTAILKKEDAIRMLRLKKSFVSKYFVANADNRIAVEGGDV